MWLVFSRCVILSRTISFMGLHTQFTKNSKMWAFDCFICNATEPSGNQSLNSSQVTRLSYKYLVSWKGFRVVLVSSQSPWNKEGSNECCIYNTTAWTLNRSSKGLTPFGKLSWRLLTTLSDPCPVSRLLLLVLCSIHNSTLTFQNIYADSLSLWLS